MSWQSVALNEWRRLWLVFLAIGLGAAVSSHYYGVLVLGILALGELVRSVTLKRFDVPVWVAFALALLPLLLSFPLIPQAMTQSGRFWAPAHWGAIPSTYIYLLRPAVLPLVAALVLSSAYPASRFSTMSSTSDAVQVRPAVFEIAAGFGFILIPILAVSGGKFVTGAFTPRYVLPAVIGFSILVAFGVFRLWGSWEPMIAILVLCMCAGFAFRAARTFRNLGWEWDYLRDSQSFLQSHTDTTLPIAVSDAHLFFLLAHYAPPDLAQRIVYLADPDASLHYLGFDSPEQGMVRLLKPWFHLRVEDYESYIASQKHFFVYGAVGNFLNWILSDLIARHMQIEPKAREGDLLLFLVSSNQSARR
jgi:hypothetical protein